MEANNGVLEWNIDRKWKWKLLHTIYMDFWEDSYVTLTFHGRAHMNFIILTTLLSKSAKKYILTGKLS